MKVRMYRLQYHSVIYQENMLSLLFILTVFPILTHQALLPNPNGIICNVEMFRTSTELVVGRYFCVPSKMCREGGNRSPAAPFDACRSYFFDAGGDTLKCCHQSDMIFGPSSVWDQTNRYLPGLQSYLMCLNHSHSLCGFDNRNLCYKDIPDSTSNRGIPTAIEKYPHTALIGYRKDDETWNWFCIGSIINKRHILTSTFCLQHDLIRSTHVKVGESRICPECPDRRGEQVLEIEKSEIASGQGLQEVALVVVKKDIVYNAKVRPACLAARQPTRQSDGWFARYGKPGTLIKTKQGLFPVFFFPKNESLVTFKVKTSQEAHIILSEYGSLYARSRFFKVLLGTNSNTESGIRRGQYKADVNTPNILAQDFRGFWIRYDKGHISVGREDETAPFMEWYDPDPFQPSVVGLSTPTGTGEWIFADTEALFSLHDLELEVYYAEDCKEHYRNITTTQTYERSTGDTHYVDDIVFCAGELGTGKGPCDNDWGGTIQVVDDNLYCMWQIFGVYGVHAKSYPRQCSAHNPPAIFTNMANLMVWAEQHAFPDFSLNDINIQRPSCTIPQEVREQPGRCQ